MQDLFIRQFDDLRFRVDTTHDGLTVEAMVVPYNREIEAIDIRPDGVITYPEVFRPGSNARAVRAPNRVGLTFLHDETFGALLGYGMKFREEPDGLLGWFRLYDSTAGKARDVLGSSHRSLSVGFTSITPRAGTETGGTLVERVSVALRHAAAVPQGQYAEARILALRAAEEPHMTAGSEDPRPEGEPPEVPPDAGNSGEDVDASPDADLFSVVDELVSSQRALDERFGKA